MPEGIIDLARARKLTCDIVAIDVGTEESGWVAAQQMPNTPRGYALVAAGNDGNHHIREALLVIACGMRCTVLLEELGFTGMPANRELLQTAIWTGRFVEVAERFAWPCYMIPRRTVKIAICDSMRATDANIRAALIELWGGKHATRRGRAARGKTAQAIAPGPLAGITKHAWAALALVETFAAHYLPLFRDTAKAWAMTTVAENDAERYAAQAKV